MRGMGEAYQGLEIDEDIAFQRRQWRLERTGWVCMGVVLSAALLGLFGGSGWLGRVSVREESVPIRVEFQRFGRWQTPETVRVRIDGAAASAERVELWIGQELLDAVEVSAIIPEPERREIGADGLLLTFDIEPTLAAGEGEATGERTIQITVKPRRAGLVRGRIGLSARQAIEIREFVYP